MTERTASWTAQLRPWYELSALRAGLGTVWQVHLQEASALSEVLAWGHERGLRLLPLGGGTNFIGMDDAEAKVAVLRLGGAVEEVRPDDDGGVQVGAGQSLGGLLVRLARCGWGGMSALSGIPGTLGGALAMNAGANGSEMAPFVDKLFGVKMTDGTSWTWRRGAGGWGYRTSPVPADVMLTHARLRLRPVETTQEVAAIAAERARRARVTPKGLSCGSVFRNPAGQVAGRLLQDAGCKGLKRGNFSVSEEHANWIVNLTGQPGAAGDCHGLLQEMRRRVYARFGVMLAPEWRLADTLVSGIE